MQDYIFECCCFQILVPTFLSSISLNRRSAFHEQGSKRYQIGSTFYQGHIGYSLGPVLYIAQIAHFGFQIIFSSFSRSPGTASHGESLTLPKAGAHGVLGMCSAAGGATAHVSPTVWLPMCWLSIRAVSVKQDLMCQLSHFYQSNVHHTAISLSGFWRFPFWF